MPEPKVPEPILDAILDLDGYRGFYTVEARSSERTNMVFYDLLFQDGRMEEPEVCWSTMSENSMHGFIAGLTYCHRAMSNGDDF